MRRFVLYLLIGLLPLQSWAVPALSHAVHGGIHAASVASDVHADLPCHGQSNQDQSVVAGPSVPHQPGGPMMCEDCQVCDLCHLAWSLFLPPKLPASVEAHRLPDGQAIVWPSRHWPPPLEPPRT
jgi:hypothetical protein